MIKTPIVVVESFDVSVYSSIEHLEASLEPVDVRDNIYLIYDSNAHLLDISLETVEKKHHFLFFSWVTQYEKIVLSEHYPITEYTEELRNKLIASVDYWKKSKEKLTEMTLSELIQIARK